MSDTESPADTPLPGQERCPDCAALLGTDGDFCKYCGAERDGGEPRAE